MTAIEVQITEQPKPKYTVVRFNGNITWRGQENGLPPIIYAYLILENATDQFINKMVEDQSRAFVASQSMYVQKDQGATIDIRETPQNRMLVPFHNIVCITVDVMPLVGDLSLPDEQGVERLPNGKEPLKQ